MILRSPGETLEGSDLLDEVAGSLGVLLWRALRSVTLWASVRPAGRARLFAPAARERWLSDTAAVPAQTALREPLGVFGLLLASPGAVAPERVARACTAVAGWAEEAGAPRAALAFFQAAAVASPGSAAAALATALRAGGVGEGIRAETWLRRAVVLARARRDRVTQAQATLDLARILARRGEAARAARLYGRTLRLAERSGLRRIRDEALREMGEIVGERRAETAAGRHP